MRLQVLVVALFVAGCTSANPPQDDGTPPAAIAAPVNFDRLTDQLAAGSETWQDFLEVEDEVAIGNGTVQFTTGLGMGCQGNADGAAPNATGWVACKVRLAARPDAEAQNVHALGIGYDLQRLSRRQAGEAVEWRVVVTTAVAATHGDQAGDPVAATAFDSGWRLVDLSPRLEAHVVTVEVLNPCDAADAYEEARQLRRGAAVIKVNLTASHGRPLVQVDLGPRSVPGDGESTPYATHSTFEHAFYAEFGTIASVRDMSLKLAVDLEAPETAGGAPESSCEAPVGGETQDWRVDVGIRGPDGAVEFVTRSFHVDVVFDAAAI